MQLQHLAISSAARGIGIETCQVLIKSCGPLSNVGASTAMAAAAFKYCAAASHGMQAASYY